MRTFLIPLTIIGLVAGASFALAQDHDRGGPRGGEQHGGPRGGEPRGGEQRGGEQRGGPAMSGPREHREAPAMRAAPNPPANAMRSYDNDRRDNRAMRGPDNGPRRDFNRPGNRPNNAMRGGPRRDFSSVRNFHQNFRAERRFHAPVYRRPPGWYARRWTWGEFLPVAFWPRNYWITDFYIYDLPPPPFGAIWVRVGD